MNEKVDLELGEEFEGIEDSHRDQRSDLALPIFKASALELAGFGNERKLLSSFEGGDSSMMQPHNN